MENKPSRRLADLLIEPRERLEVELKGWIDIVNDSGHRALLAKAIIALANHAGGFVICGFEENDSGVMPASNRPATLSDYNPDTINAVVSKYVEPEFHCDIILEAAPDGLLYPIISVPGGHAVPIRSKRDAADGTSIRKNLYYVRRPGPKSEPPQSGQEWDALIRRSIANARDDLLEQMRTILQGGPAALAEPSRQEQLYTWFAESLDRWSEVVRELTAENPARFPLGHFSLAYTLTGNLREPTATELKDALERSKLPHTGWPEFWVPTKRSIAPYPHDGNIECWIGRDGEIRGPGYVDFWRASPQARLFLIRGYQEDEAERADVETGKGFAITTATWRTGEALLHASNMATALGDPEAQVNLVVEWTGLKGRHLVTSPGDNRTLTGLYEARQDRYRGETSVQANQIPDALPELVGRFVYPLYECFDFFQLPARLIAEELSKMRANRF